MALSINHQGQEAFLGNEPHLEVSQKRRFSEMIFWLLSERQPMTSELIVFELILNLSIDHGPDTPSAKATISTTEAGKSIGEAVAAGISQINDVHGGAQELCMGMLYQMIKEKISAETIIANYLGQKVRVAGFGHRLYTELDPRAELIINTLEKQGMGQEFISASRGLGIQLSKQTGKKLPLNIDGAIAVALCAFGWAPALGKAVFIIARTPGLCGQYINTKN